MTQLAILPNYDKKRLKCYGTVAAGEHVNVTVTGGMEWVAPGGEAQTLRLRLLFGPHTVGVFPFVTEEMHEEDSETFPTVDEWDTDGEDPTCDLNLNTIQAAKFLKFGGTCLFVLDDPTNDILYATGECEVLSWPKRRGADLPYDLDGYPDFVADAKAAIAQSAADAQSAASNAANAVERVDEALDEANSFVDRAESAATGAQASAAEAKGWANGGADDDTPGATNNAKYYSEQADSAKTDAEDARDEAEDLAEYAEAWAVGQRGGTDVPSGDAAYENNAKHYAEQAAASAQEAADTLDDKADVATTLAGYGITDAYTKTETDGAIASAISSEVTNRNDAIANAISAVKDSAPAAFDTLKEIADWIGNGQSGAQAVINQVANKVDKVSGKGLSTNDYTTAEKQKLANIETGANKYVLPPATANALGGVKQGTGCEITADGTLNVTSGGLSITIDPSLSPTSENPVQNKAVAKALYTGFTEWVCDSISDGWTFVSCEWKTYAQVGTGWFATVNNGFLDAYVFMGTDAAAVALTKGSSSGFPALSLFRHLITPTKTSQLTNDGEPNGGGNPYVMINDPRLSDERTPTAHTHAMADVTGLGAALAQKADTTDLPYAMVTPGEWEFSPPTYQGQTLGLDWRNGNWAVLVDGTEFGVFLAGDENALNLSFDMDVRYTATRSSLPGHLCDRAGNRVGVTGDTTLTLPAAVPGYIRDFLVRLEISGSTVPTITFAAPTGETIVYETDGDEFPVPDEAGTWIYSFTESCAAHKFAMSLKKVNIVAQGGS